jgi:tetratricopeptide (TPR) repeat protein
VRTATRGPSGTDAEKSAATERGPENTGLFVAGILGLQQTAGNSAVARMLQRQEAVPESEGADTEAARKLFQRGAAAYEKGQFAHAYDYFTRAYELSSRSGIVFSQAQALRRLGGRRDEAIALYEQYLAMDDITRKKDAESALTELRGPAATGDEAIDTEAARKLFAKGAAAYGRNQFAQAYDYFTQASELSSRSGIVFSQAQALRRLGGRRDEAIALYEQYLAMDDITRKKDAESALADLKQSGAAP